MLELNPKLVCNLIVRAQEFHTKEEVVIPEPPLSPTDNWVYQVLADHVDDQTFLEVKALIDDMEPDQQASLVALMWIGRGDYEVSELAGAKADALEDARKRSAEYLFAHPLVADYLREGLELLGYSCEDE
ncbi:MAG: hypothetical protein BMS9Abin33_0697 [Gammaproteobacteria bacterium]|nr:MAG: hypothetical protein BMS9Abin33_0697 [Gammaproteobacteria bacterium]